MRVLTWYKSWFRWDGTLEPDGYIQHLVAAFGFFFGLFALAVSVGMLALWGMVAAHAPAWMGWLVIAIYMPLGLLAIYSWTGILITSTTRFVRFLIADCASPEKSRS
jgi:hypothetical protein